MNDSTTKPEGPNPSGLCMCGCGGLVPLAKWTRPRTGLVKGKPVRYIRGHQHHLCPTPYVVAENGCWVWQRGTNGKGYGNLWVEGHLTYAHRHYYEQRYGPIPDGLQLDHLCRNRSCVNPEHLEVVTSAENTRRGNRAKLTESDVISIRSRFASGETQASLSREYGITNGYVSNLCSGRFWSDIPTKGAK